MFCWCKRCTQQSAESAQAADGKKMMAAPVLVMFVIMLLAESLCTCAALALFDCRQTHT